MIRLILIFLSLVICCFKFCVKFNCLVIVWVVIVVILLYILVSCVILFIYLIVIVVEFMFINNRLGLLIVGGLVNCISWILICLVNLINISGLSVVVVLLWKFYVIGMFVIGW